MEPLGALQIPLVLPAAFVAGLVAIGVTWLVLAELRAERRGATPAWVALAFVGGLSSLFGLAALAEATLFGGYLALILLGIFLAWAVAYYGFRLTLRALAWRRQRRRRSIR